MKRIKVKKERSKKAVTWLGTLSQDFDSIWDILKEQPELKNSLSKPEMIRRILGLLSSDPILFGLAIPEDTGILPGSESLIGEFWNQFIELVKTEMPGENKTHYEKFYLFLLDQRGLTINYESVFDQIKEQNKDDYPFATSIALPTIEPVDFGTLDHWWDDCEEMINESPILADLKFERETYYIQEVVELVCTKAQCLDLYTQLIS